MNNINIKEQQVAPLNTVKTVLSKSAVELFEITLYDFWNDLSEDSFTDKIMLMLSVYTEHYPEDVHMFRRPKYMVEFVSKLIDLKETLDGIARDEHVWDWEDTKDGWRMPINN